MKRILSLLSLLVVGLCAFAQTSRQPQPLTNADVITMVRTGATESSIILAIQKTPAKFDVSAEGILALHDAGVSNPVLNAMMRTPKPQQQPGFGVLTGTFPVKDAAGKTVRFSAWIKTENVHDGQAGLWWRVDGRDADNKLTAIAFDNSASRLIDGQPASNNGMLRGATGTTQWTRYEFELPVDKAAANINFGVLFFGTGTAWVDSMKVELDGQPYTDPHFDFDFESPKAKGFYAGCGGTGDCGYKVGIDDTVSYLGHQSLKMQSVGNAVAQK
jgi:hypothetical protein